MSTGVMARQSTAVTLDVGPILDSTGAEYASAVIGDLTISKNGTRAAMSGNTFNYAANGMYSLTLTTGNTDTLGVIQISCNKATYQMRVVERQIVHANVYDSVVLGTDYLQVDALQLAGSTQSATDLKDFADTGYDPATHTLAEAVVLDSAVATQINKIEAAVSGTVSGAGTSTEVFVGPNATLTITVDASGNRTNVSVS